MIPLTHGVAVLDEFTRFASLKTNDAPLLATLSAVGRHRQGFGQFPPARAKFEHVPPNITSDEEFLRVKISHG